MEFERRHPIERKSPTSLIIIGGLGMLATYENTTINAYLSPFWRQCDRLRVEEDGVVHQLFKGSRNSQNMEFLLQTHQLMVHQYPASFAVYPNDEQLAAYTEWQAAYIPKDPRGL